MGNALISVIVPIYNLENYLSKCIDSVLAQTYTNFEIIAVDDGSTDNSAQLLKEYSLKDNRVKPIFKENGGVSSARNTGLENCSGEYIYFLDGDDWIAPDTLEKLSKYSEKFDIVQAGYIESYSDGTEKLAENSNFSDREFTDNEEIIAYYFLALDQNFCFNKLYRKSVIGDVRFNETFAVAEDSAFVYSVLKKIKNIKFIKDITYYYFIRENSCMHTALSEKHFATLELRDVQYQEVKDNKRLFKKFIYRYSNDLLFLIHRILNDNSGKFEYKIPSLRKKVLKEKISIFLSPYIKLRFKAGIFILWLFPGMFYKIYSKYKEGMS